MCVLLWALTDSAVHVLMFSSCFTAKLRISQRRHRRIAHPEQYFYVLSRKSEHFHPLKSATCARFSPYVVNVTDQPRISYGLDQSAPSKIRFFRFKPSSCNLYGAERIFSNCHGAERSGYPLIEIITDLAERIIRTNLLSRIRTDFPRMSRSGYPPLRNVTDRCGLGNPLRNNPDYGLYFNPYT